MGWSAERVRGRPESSPTVGLSRGRVVQVLHAMWKDDPAEFSGRYYKLPKSAFDLRPVQRPHPPIYFAASPLVR